MRYDDGPTLWLACALAPKTCHRLTLGGKQNGEETYPEGPLGFSIQCETCGKRHIEVVPHSLPALCLMVGLFFCFRMRPASLVSSLENDQEPQVRFKLDEPEEIPSKDLLGKRKIGDPGCVQTPQSSAVMEGMTKCPPPERGGGQLSPLRSDYSPREITLWVIRMLKQIGDLSTFDEEGGEYKNKSYSRAHDRLDLTLPLYAALLPILTRRVTG
jgi:hypothetical protein